MFDCLLIDEDEPEVNISKQKEKFLQLAYRYLQNNKVRKLIDGKRRSMKDFEFTSITVKNMTGNNCALLVYGRYVSKFSSYISTSHILIFTIRGNQVQDGIDKLRVDSQYYYNISGDDPVYFDTFEKKYKLGAFGTFTKGAR